MAVITTCNGRFYLIYSVCQSGVDIDNIPRYQAHMLQVSGCIDPKNAGFYCDQGVIDPFDLLLRAKGDLRLRVETCHFQLRGRLRVSSQAYLGLLKLIISFSQEENFFITHRVVPITKDFDLRTLNSTIIDRSLFDSTYLFGEVFFFHKSQASTVPSQNF